MSVTTASASATLTADQIIVGTALNGMQYLLSNYSETINLATTGAGGMDTGSAPASGYVALYAIYNPATGAISILATNATSAVAPNVYGGSHMPSGYTASALLAVWPTTSGSLFGIGYWSGRRFSFVMATVLSTTTVQSSFTSLSISGAVPPNAKSIGGTVTTNNSAASTSVLSVAASSAGIGQQYVDVASSAGAVSGATSFSLQLATAQTIYYSSSANAGSCTFVVQLSSYTI
ncbi:phage tail protein [Trinickia terrae]|uniref:Phage tail protein n=2 Tax=Trinickia terrae TaxID=2571161 RepID=A0A4U1HW12_9BURK|nr:phage tail protein [Trinickia terrae]